jgi:lysophospholipase L1-like esterase
MATALDLLMSTKEDVNLLSQESDICTIDAKTRAIFVPSTIVVGGVQSDKNAERIKFSCPKIVGDNLDLSKFSVRINFENVSSVDFNVSIKDQYICDDVAVDGENVTFSWLIGRNAARYMGTVRFIVCAVKTDSDSNISVEWNTTIAEVPVLEGIEIDQPQIGQEEKDVINQLLELTKNTSAEAVQNVNSAKEQAIKDIQSVSQPDTTLTIEGGLAEAKATGEAIGSLKEDIVANSNELYNKEKEEIAVEPSDYNLLENKVAYIDTNNEIMTYENANAYVMHKIVISGEKYRILSQTHGSVNTLLYAICDSNGKVINSAKMGVSPNTYITTEISIPSNGVELYLNEFPTQTYPLVVNKIETINISKINGKETVNCWGDSLTRGVGVGDSYSKAFPYVLYGLLDGREVINCGVGGENTINIASRQGGLPNIVKPFTIPANASKVEVKLTNIYGGSTGILLQGGSALDPTTGKYVMTAQINPCSINGVEGTLTYENGKYYFSRSENGESVIVSRPTPLITYAMKSMRDNINIIWIGTNGGFTTSAELIECIEAMIDYMSPINKKYIVIGIHHLVSTVTETFETIEKNMAMHFGRRYINQRKYMIEYGLSDAGITPTVEDTTAISEDKIPPSLLYDTVHYNDKGYNIIANLVVERGKELGYW